MDQNEEKTRPSPRDRAKIFSAKSHRQRLRIATRAAYFVIVVLVLLLVLFLIAKTFFSIDSVIVNMTVYEEQNYAVSAVQEASGVSEGDILFFADKKKIEENIKTSLPFVDSVSIKKEFPSTLTINIVEEKENFYFEYDGRYFVVSSGLKVLALFESEAELKATQYYSKLIPIFIDDVKQVETTKTLVFFDDQSHRRSEKVLSLICASSLYEKITSIDISELYDIKIVYDNRISIFLGEHNEEFAKKLVNSKSIIDRHSDTAKGYINIYNWDKATAVIE